MSDYGSVEGTLYKDKHGFFLKDILLSRGVWVWSNIVLDGYLGKRISIEGELKYDKKGNVMSVDHYHLPSRPCLPFVFKLDSELPTAYDVRGILAGSVSVSEEWENENNLVNVTFYLLCHEEYNELWPIAIFTSRASIKSYVDRYHLNKDNFSYRKISIDPGTNEDIENNFYCDSVRELWSDCDD